MKYRGIEASVTFSTPLWVIEDALRKSRQEPGKKKKNIEKHDMKYLHDVINTRGHKQGLKFGDVYFDLTMPRSILLEFEKHVIGNSGMDDPYSDINSSTRYTLGKLIKLFKESFAEGEGGFYYVNSGFVYDYIAQNMAIEVKHEFDYFTDVMNTLLTDNILTPDNLKMYLPESWLVTGQHKISLLALRGFFQQRLWHQTGKAHKAIEILAEKMWECLSEDQKFLIRG
jgi:thymidylate synthase ThyX